VAVAGIIPEILTGTAEVARAMYRVLSDEIGDSRGCHCIGRALRDSIDQLVHNSCAANTPSARDSGSQSEQFTGITTSQSEQLTGITTSGGIKKTL
jgi:hypothetical protein